MNVTYYVQKFDEATWTFFAELAMGGVVDVQESPWHDGR